MPERVILLLVGGRSATPTIMGALQFINEVDRVKFLLCESKNNQYKNFQDEIMKILNSQAPGILFDENVDVKIVNGNDFNASYNSVQQLCENITDLRYVNLTSVPQQMAFAVYNYVQTNYKKAFVFSVHTDSSQIIPLILGSKPRPLTRKLTVDDYIAACQKHIFQQKFDVKKLSCTEEQAQTVVEYIVRNIEISHTALSVIRKGKEITTPQSFFIEKSASEKRISLENIATFLKMLQENNIISRYEEKPAKYSYRFESKEDYAFIYGDWLEYYIYLEAKKIGFYSVEMSVELENFMGEIDVFCVHNANALICECKTGNYNSKDLSILETKAIQLGGRFCVRIFVTSDQKNPEDKEFDNFLNKAKNRHIVVVSGNEIKEIGNILRKQMDNPTYPRM